MLRKFDNENKNQNKKNRRLKIYGKIRNGRLKLEPNVPIKKTCMLVYISIQYYCNTNIKQGYYFYYYLKLVL